ncbi:hypothetical protein [Streptomyces alboflavus]|uniref:hypothetical protein n=1 Tax=Streptomyces alboflavus TaxID=67267 RepID=UPI00068BC7A7|nr:hypothetical protein [Streptomyces alboflavus]
MSAMHGRLVGLLVDRFDVDPAELAPGTTFDDLDTDSPHLLEQFLVVHAAPRAGPAPPAPPPAPARLTPTPSAASTPVS